MVRERKGGRGDEGGGGERGDEGEMEGERCARWDSRPDENANEPRGSAESERRRRVWVTGSVGLGC